MSAYIREANSLEASTGHGGVWTVGRMDSRGWLLLTVAFRGVFRN